LAPRAFCIDVAASARLRRRFASICRVLATVFFQTCVSSAVARHSFGSRCDCWRCVAYRRAARYALRSNQSMKPEAFELWLGKGTINTYGVIVRVSHPPEDLSKLRLPMPPEVCDALRNK